MIMCAKNYKSKFTFVEVIQEKVQALFLDTVYVTGHYAVGYELFYI